VTEDSYFGGINEENRDDGREYAYFTESEPSLSDDEQGGDDNDGDGDGQGGDDEDDGHGGEEASEA
jgi:hypothetical protein